MCSIGEEMRGVPTAVRGVDGTVAVVGVEVGALVDVWGEEMMRLSTVIADFRELKFAGRDEALVLIDARMGF